MKSCRAKSSEKGCAGKSGKSRILNEEKKKQGRVAYGGRGGSFEGKGKNMSSEVTKDFGPKGKRSRKQEPPLKKK